MSAGSEQPVEQVSTPPRSSRMAWTNSIRFRLTARFTGIFAALLLVGGAAFIFYIEYGMLSDADFYLARQTRRVSKLLALSPTPRAIPGNLLEANGVTVLTARFPGLLWFDTVYSRVFDAGTYRLDAQSPSLATQSSMTHALDDELRRAPADHPAFAFATPLGGRQMRVCTTYSTVQGHRYILQTAVPWDSQEYRISGVEVVLAGSIAVVLALGALGGWFLIGHALRPIDRIVTRAEAVDAESLSGDLLPAPRETDSEIGRLVDTLNRMAGRLHRAFTAQQRYAEAQRRFAADASHELRTPLTVLRTEIEYALLKPRGVGEYREALEAAVTAIDRLGRIVESLMFLARLDVGRIRQTATDRPIDVDALASSVVRELEPEAAGHALTLTYAGEAPLGVLGEEEQIRLLMRNLVENAVKYTPDGGRVTVNSEMEERGGAKFAVISVSDTGIGLEQEEIPQVFDRFWRSTRARGRGRQSLPGAGLGLSIARQIAIAHGGEITVESTSGEGATFRVRLPLAP